MTPQDRAALRASCTRFLSHARPRSAADWLTGLAASPHAALALDSYSAGPAIEALETTIAGLLGKEAALWFPKGIVAQQAALKAHAAASGRNLVAIHPKSHLAVDEGNALERLAGLTTVRVGKDHSHFTPEDLDAIAEPLAAVTLELPLRRAGYQALPWADLEAVSQWARDKGVPFHLDAARLWEVQPWYDRPWAEIAGLADSLYVSLYKGLGGLGGSLLAGSRDFIARAKPWRLRYGGDLPLAFPMVISALDGLDNNLPKMAERHRHAFDLAAAIAKRPGLSVFPNPPHSNAFQVHFAAPAEAMRAAALAEAAENRVWLFGDFEDGLVPDHCWAELVVGDAAMEWTPTEAADAIAGLHADNLTANPAF